MDYVDFLQPLLMGTFGWVGAGIWGLLWGSFFNVMIFRLPQEQSLVSPASHCQKCGAPIRWYDNVPVISYLLLSGRCRHCKASFSLRYLLVEVLVGLLSLSMYATFVIHGTDPLSVRLAQFFITSLFCGLLVAIAFIDFDTFRIPDSITYPAIPVCAGLSLFMRLPHSWDGPVGAIGGYAVIRLIADGYRWVTGRDGMGYGDAKLLAMIGGLLGWQVLMPTLFLAALQGSLIGITALVVARKRGHQTRDDSPMQKQQPLGDDEQDRILDGEGNVHCGVEKAVDDGVGDERVGLEDEEQINNAEPSDLESLRYARIPFGPFLSMAGIEMLWLREWVMGMFFPM
jgi:leader peptidase (prepilin peptidase)/N-methyltransferase